jgi:heptosyltransferase-3
MATLGVDSVLVVRSDRLGDWVLTLPLLERLKAAASGLRLGAMGTAAVAPLLERCPAVDAVVVSKRGLGGFRETTAEVRRGGFDAAVVVHPDMVDTLVVWWAGVKLRVGNGYRGYSFLYNRRVYFHRSPSTRHEIEYNLEYLKALGLPVPAEAIAPRLDVTEADRAKARELLAARGVADEGYVVIHPGSGGSSLNWSPRRYRVLAAELSKALGAAVVVTGSAAEAELASYVAGEGAGRVSVAGETDLGTLLGVLAGARLFVSSNTGPMHLAAAVGTPTLSLFSPLRSGAPARWGPRGERAAVITPAGLVCETCRGEQCENFNCMEAITVEEVLAGARRVAART